MMALEQEIKRCNTWVSNYQDEAFSLNGGNNFFEGGGIDGSVTPFNSKNS